MAQAAGQQMVAVNAQGAEHLLQGVEHGQGHTGHAAQVLGLGAVGEHRRVRVAARRNLIDALELGLRERHGPRLYNLAAQILVLYILHIGK